MVSESLTALVMAEHDLKVKKVLPIDYFISNRLGEEESLLKKKGFIETTKKDGETGYSITSTGKKVLSELDEYYNIISVENISV